MTTRPIQSLELLCQGVSDDELAQCILAMAESTGPVLRLSLTSFTWYDGWLETLRQGCPEVKYLSIGFTNLLFMVSGLSPWVRTSLRQV